MQKEKTHSRVPFLELLPRFELGTSSLPSRVPRSAYVLRRSGYVAQIKF